MFSFFLNNVLNPVYSYLFPSQMDIISKSLINSPKALVSDSLKGLIYSKNLRLINSQNVIIVIRKNGENSEKVKVISGGGSGHEPAHAGYVGKGMLDAAICGQVFTSPDVESILKTIMRMANKKNECLLVIKNYTGDVLNFKLAAQMARQKGVKVEEIIVADDAAFGKLEKSKKRGLAGTIFVHKCCGAISEMGMGLKKVKDVGLQVIKNIATMGVSLGPTAIPGKKVMFYIPDDEIEMGLGIHGEKGIERIKLKSSDEIVEKMLKQFILKENPLKEGDRIALMINNLGGVSQLELYIFCGKVIEILEKEVGVIIERVYVGSLMTSISMKGASITTFKLPKNREDEFLTYLDYDTECTAFPTVNEIGIDNRGRCDQKKCFSTFEEGKNVGKKTKASFKLNEKGKIFKSYVVNICKTMIESEEELNDLDSAIGDGDCGNSLSNGAKDILENIDTINFNNASESLYELGIMIQRIGGSSGAIYCSLLIAMSQSYKENKGEWGKIIKDGCDAVTELGGAKEGDGTFLDSLIPVYKAKLNDKECSLNDMYLAAKNGADSTIDIIKKKGRAAYLSERSQGNYDPGAKNILNIFGSLKNKFS